MAITRITKGVIKPNENYDTHDINSTGIVTTTGLDVNGNADISGSLSVGGVLTYEDVTSIDSVGIITAQKDIHVGAGVSAVGVGTFGGLVSPYADIDDFLDVGSNIKLGNAGIVTAAAVDVDDFLDVGSNIKLGNAGVITATSFVGSGAALTGIDATAIKDSGGNVKVQAQASGAMYTGIHTFSSGAEIGSNIKFGNAGVVTATSYRGDGSQLTGIVADKIFEGDTEVECVDSGSGEVIIKVDGTDVLKAIKGSTNFGKIGINQFNDRHSPVTIAHTSTAAVDVNLSLTSPTSAISVGGGTGIFMKSSNANNVQKRYGTFIQSIRSSNDNGSPDFVILKENAAASGLAEHLRIDAAGQVLPGADNQQNLGSSTKRWQNIYAADMHYSNEGDKNSVDGTWGSYTIQEGESDLFLINNRSGKKYKFNLTEVN